MWGQGSRDGGTLLLPGLPALMGTPLPLLGLGLLGAPLCYTRWSQWLPDGTNFGTSLPHWHTSSDGLYEPHHHHEAQLKPEESPVARMAFYSFLGPNLSLSCCIYSPHLISQTNLNAEKAE